MDIRYPAKIETQEDGTFFVRFLDLPDTFTEGHTMEEALFNLETAVGRARVGRDAVRWQGATTLQADAREEEQRRQRAAAWPDRVNNAVCFSVISRIMNSSNHMRLTNQLRPCIRIFQGQYIFTRSKLTVLR